MEQFYFSERIAGLRRQYGLTQENLARRLGVAHQAVSQWESGQCCPDVMLLPKLADVFGISMDAFFNRVPPVKSCASLPWEDNDDVYAVCFQGHRLIDSTVVSPTAGPAFLDFGNFSGVNLHFYGEAGNVTSAFAVTCQDTVIHGNVHAGNRVECSDVGGNVTAGIRVECSNVAGSIRAGEDVECCNVGGNVTAGEGVECGDVAGSVTAEGSIQCGCVGGNARADGCIVFECSCAGAAVS